MTKLELCTLNLRNLEKARDGAKHQKIRAEITIQIRQARAAVDQELFALIQEQKEIQDSKAVKEETGSDDYGPKEWVDLLHTYANMRLSLGDGFKEGVLATKFGIGVAGRIEGIDYVLHFQAS